MCLETLEGKDNNLHAAYILQQAKVLTVLEFKDITRSTFCGESRLRTTTCIPLTQTKTRIYASLQVKRNYLLLIHRKYRPEVSSYRPSLQTLGRGLYEKTEVLYFSVKTELTYFNKKFIIWRGTCIISQSFHVGPSLRKFSHSCRLILSAAVLRKIWTIKLNAKHQILSL